MMDIIVGCYLFWGAWQDIKTKKIGSLYLMIGGISGILYCIVKIINQNYFISQWIIAIIPGLVTFVLAKIWKEKIGVGDGMILLVLGNFMTAQQLWVVLNIALWLVMIFSILLISIKRVSKNIQIPFLPFLWLAYILLKGLPYV